MSLDQQHGTVSPEQEERESQLVERVVASFDAAPDPRFRELMQALTRHLHAFVREVRLTEEEWQRAIGFLTSIGHITDDRRQEFILLSDVLGVSMQTITINNEAYQNATEATVFGRSSSRAHRRSSSAATSRPERRGNRAGSRAPSRTRTASRSRMR